MHFTSLVELDCSFLCFFSGSDFVDTSSKAEWHHLATLSDGTVVDLGSGFDFDFFDFDEGDGFIDRNDPLIKERIRDFIKGEKTYLGGYFIGDPAHPKRNWLE